jgi:hypothetical protein
LPDTQQVSTEKWIVLSAINLPQPCKMVDTVPVLSWTKEMKRKEIYI